MSIGSQFQDYANIIKKMVPDQQQLILVKTNVAGYFFDAFLKLDYKSTLKITEHPVQSGAAVTDHAYMQPRELSMDIGMSDCMHDIIPNQFSGSWSRSVRAYEVLKELQANRVPFDVLTRLGKYTNMLIESISASDDNKTLYGLRATIAMKEIIVAEVTTVQISARSQLTGATNVGTVEPVPVPVDRSALKSMYLNGQGLSSLFGGK